MGIMINLIYAKFCSLLSSIFDLIGIGSFFLSSSLDDKSNRLIGRETSEEVIERWRNEQ